MKEITAYLSKDGALFKDCEKCLEHEINSLIRDKKILFFSEGGYEIDTAGYDFSYLFHNCDFIKIDEEAWSTVHRFCQEQGWICPNCFNDTGIWRFDNSIYRWISVEAEIIDSFEDGYFLTSSF